MWYSENWITVLPEPVSRKDAGQPFSYLVLNFLVYKSEGSEKRLMDMDASVTTAGERGMGGGGRGYKGNKWLWEKYN